MAGAGSERRGALPPGSEDSLLEGADHVEHAVKAKAADALHVEHVLRLAGARRAAGKRAGSRQRHARTAVSSREQSAVCERCDTPTSAEHRCESAATCQARPSLPKKQPALRLSCGGCPRAALLRCWPWAPEEGRDGPERGARVERSAGRRRHARRAGARGVVRSQHTPPPDGVAETAWQRLAHHPSRVPARAPLRCHFNLVTPNAAKHAAAVSTQDATASARRPSGTEVPAGLDRYQTCGRGLSHQGAGPLSPPHAGRPAGRSHQHRRARQGQGGDATGARGASGERRRRRRAGRNKHRRPSPPAPLRSPACVVHSRRQRLRLGHPACGGLSEAAFGD